MRRHFTIETCLSLPFFFFLTTMTFSRSFIRMQNWPSGSGIHVPSSNTVDVLGLMIVINGRVVRNVRNVYPINQSWPPCWWKQHWCRESMNAPFRLMIAGGNIFFSQAARATYFTAGRVRILRLDKLLKLDCKGYHLPTNYCDPLSYAVGDKIKKTEKCRKDVEQHLSWLFGLSSYRRS